MGALSSCGCLSLAFSNWVGAAPPLQVWVAFILGAAALGLAQGCALQQRLARHQLEQQVACQQGHGSGTSRHSVQQQQQQKEPEAVPGVLMTLKVLWSSRGMIMLKLWPLAMVPTAFAVFLIWNKVLHVFFLYACVHVCLCVCAQMHMCAHVHVRVCMLNPAKDACPCMAMALAVPGLLKYQSSIWMCVTCS